MPQIGSRALQYEALNDPEMRVRRLAKYLADAEAELAKRNVADLPTSRLFSLIDTLRRRIVQETGSVKFADPDAYEPDEDIATWKG